MNHLIFDFRFALCYGGNSVVLLRNGRALRILGHGFGFSTRPRRRCRCPRVVNGRAAQGVRAFDKHAFHKFVVDGRGQ